MGPTYYQRLMKFTSDTVYAISKGRTDELTRQPLVGKARHGSLRLGEMEVWVCQNAPVVNFKTSKKLTASLFNKTGKTAKLFGKSLKL